MAKSLFDPQAKAELCSRLDQITESTIPQWGIMKPAQMVHHVNLSAGIAANELKIPDRSNFLTRTLLRYFMLSGKVPSVEMANKRKPQTFDEINMLKGNISFDSLETEKKKLKAKWEKLIDFKEFPDRHPLIGKMNRSDWGKQLYSHANYHFTQFGV